jgi:integral membrane protein
VKQLFLAYRVLATVVGCSIIVLIVIGVPLKYAYHLFPDFWTSFLENGSPGQRFGTDVNMYLGIAHGFIYMAFLVVALLLGLTARWPFDFLIITLLCGTIPFLSFWAEARAIRRVRTQFPELAAST